MLAYIKFGDEIKSPNRQIKNTIKCTVYTVCVYKKCLSWINPPRLLLCESLNTVESILSHDVHNTGDDVFSKPMNRLCDLTNLWVWLSCELAVFLH